MKRFLLCTFLSITYFSIFAQNLVDTLPHNKKVVLEEYTGIHCQYCPDGHKIANQIKTAHPNDVFLINIHQGSYANPGAGEPNFKTSFGDALAAQTGLTGYPSGTINRHVFSGTTTALSRSVWTADANLILAQPSYANVGVNAIVNVQTGVLTVNVEIYYTGNAPSLNMLNVALLQNNLEGPQTGGSQYNPTQILPNGNYNHGHMLRHLITGQWGDSINVTSQGTFLSKTYTYTLPSSINNVALEYGNLNVIAFLAQGKQEIITGSETKVKLSNFLYSRDISITNVSSYNDICNDSIQPTVRIKNLGSDTVTSISFQYSINGNSNLTYNWTGFLLPYSSSDIVFPFLTSFTVMPSNAITVSIGNINGNTDQNSTNDTFVKSNILQTNNITSGANGHVFTFVQDRYGSESTWKIIEDETNTVIASGGPYADLSANGTLSHDVNITFSNAGCYTVIVNDAYGDGINSGYGAGSYKLVNAANEVVLSSNGVFSKQDRKVFNLSSLVGYYSHNLQIFNNNNLVSNNGVLNVKFAVNDTIKLPLKVKNISGVPINVKVKKIYGNIITGTDTTNSFQFNGQNYSHSNFVSNDSANIAPVSFDSSFVAKYFTNGLLGYSKITYVFYNISNMSDSMSIAVNYNSISNLEIYNNNSLVTNNGSINIIKGINDTIILPLKVSNISGTPIRIKIKKVYGNMIAGTENTNIINFNSINYIPSIMNTPDSNVIYSHTIDSSFIASYWTNGVEGTSKITYVFFNIDNPQDTMCVNVNYITSTVGINQHKDIYISNLYPNPAKNNVAVSFNINDDKDVNINIFNSLGAMVYSQNKGILTSGNHTVNVNVSKLSSGVYYMNVKAGDNTITKKLIIE